MTKPQNITADEIVKLMRAAIKQFGTYSYDDKGPQEVMDIPAIGGRLRALGVDKAAIVLKALRAKAIGKSAREIERCWSAIMVYLQDWDEFMDGPVEADEALQGY